MNRYDVWVIAAIWFAVFLVSGSFVEVDENYEALDPDKETTVAVLGLIAGGLMTGVYLLVRNVRKTRPKKKTGRFSLSASENGADLRARAGVVDVVVALVLSFAGGALFSGRTSDWLSVLAPLAYLLLVLVRNIRRSRSALLRDVGGV
jgi:hypothetical protein